LSCRVRGRGVFLFGNGLRRERSSSAEDLPVNDNLALPCAATHPVAQTAARFRRIAIWLILAGTVAAATLAVGLKVRVDPVGTAVLDWVIAALLLISRMWWQRRGHQRIADACGTVAVAALGGMAGGAVAMLELRLGFPVADDMLHSFDQAMGIDGIVIVEALLRQGDWLFAIMAPAYNFTVPIFFISLALLSFSGDRTEAWRAALCFVGTLLTTCVIASFVPAKGLGVWAPDALLAQLPPRAMRTFWPHFDEFYFGDDPVLRLQVIDGVISFPSFHSVVGFLTVAMWRKRIVTLVPAATYLAFMLLAIFPGGGHYFVDMLGGFAVWAAWFALSRRIEQRLRPEVTPVPLEIV
jgi:hypothetical protein